MEGDKLFFVQLEGVQGVLLKKFVRYCGYFGEQQDDSLIYITNTEESSEFRLVRWWLDVLQAFGVDLAHLQGSLSDDMSNIFDLVA